MPSEMIACPHCGQQVSQKKRFCHHCQRELVSPADLGIPQRELRPRGPEPDNTTQRPLTPNTAQRSPALEPTPLPTVPRARPTLGMTIFGVSLRQRVQFYQQFYGLLKSGIPVSVALGYLEKNMVAQTRPMIRNMATIAQRGGAISEGMLQYPTIFPQWEVSLVIAAENSGTLPEAMRDIAEALELEAEMRSEVNAKLFPLQVTAVFFIMVVFLIASIGRVKSGNAMEVLSAAGGGISIALALIVAALVIWQIWRVYTRTQSGALVNQWLVTHLPLIGPITNNMMRMRFARVLGALWHAGVAPMEAFLLASRACGNRSLEYRISKIADELGRGGSFSEAFMKTRLFPTETNYMIQTGETSGSITEALKNIANYIELDLQQQVKTLPMKAQTMMYLILGPAIGYFVVKFYMDYFGAMFK